MAWVRLSGARDLRWHGVYRGPDADLVRRLARSFQALNARHFGGALPLLPIRLSERMRTRLGHIVLERTRGAPVAIVLSRRHVAEHGWRDVEDTLLHEMVHLWQSVNGQKVDHGPRFRAMARQVGVAAAARRHVRPSAMPRVRPSARPRDTRAEASSPGT